MPVGDSSETGEDFFTRELRGLLPVFLPCPHCNATAALSGEAVHPQNFYVQHKIGMSGMCKIGCPCGVMTGLQPDVFELLRVWNTRNGVQPTLPERERVSVRFPDPPGLKVR